MVLAKWDTSCTVQWAATWGEAGVSEVIASMCRYGGSFFLCGCKSAGGPAGWDGLLVEASVAGEFVSSKYYGSPTYCAFNGIAGDAYGAYTTGTLDVAGSGNEYDAIFVDWTLESSITHPADVSYTYQSTGNSISWTVGDASTGTANYSIYREGTSCFNGTWTSGVPIVFNIDGLAVGSYRYRIVARDGLGGTDEDVVLVTVQNAAPPPAVNGYVVGLVFIAMAASLALLAVKKRPESQ
ncbi:MAG: hypothetical protein JW839_05160 [Candidatus Lokiarchaeota archaeon]|nr:hypothetical protein [Candidatus Lokiarchaeota archaeon]